MRALRSRAVENNSGNSEDGQNTEKVVKRKKEKLFKKSKKKLDLSLKSQSSESDTFKKTLKNEESKHTTNKKSRRTTGNSTIKEAIKENVSPNNKKSRRTTRNITIKEAIKKKVSPDINKKSRRTTRNSTIKEAIKENVSPNIKVSSKHSKTKNKRKIPLNQNTSEELSSINKTRLTRNSTNFNINNQSQSNGSTFEITHDLQEYSPLFKNIVTSTTIKPKKPKRNNKPKAVLDETKVNILLENDADVINISDSIHTNITDALNSTYLKINDESVSIVTTKNSGQWKIEELKSVVNISDEKIFESNKDTKKVFFQEKSVTKSARKKWQRFTRNSQEANTVLKQINTPQKKTPSNLNISKKLNKTGNTTRDGGEQSINKIKRTVMPNFALLHQKAFEKMESIADYSQRKKERANMLLSNQKLNETSKPENKMKMASRQLFINEKHDKPATSKIKVNRFGFKVKTDQTNFQKPSTNVQKPLKPSIYEREDVVAIANKKVQNSSKLRDNKRDILKGVRTNRRFELLMKMRNN